MNDHRDQPPPPRPRVAPDMGSHNLQRVVPVAQQQTIDNMSLLIYSLEMYTTGFIAVVRLSWVGSGGMPPPLSWTARDEHGTTIPWVDSAGSGGGRPPDHFSWRLNYMFGAPVPEGSTQLELAARASRPSASTSDANGSMQFVIDLSKHAAT